MSTARASSEYAPTVLIVEDDPDIAASVEFVMTEAGFQVQTALSGAAAERALEAGAIDLVLLDLMLPDMSGLDLLKRLRNGNSSTRVIIVTARRDEVDRIVGFELGADDYVSKPFSPRELVLRSRAVLERVRITPSNPSTLHMGPIQIDMEFHVATVAGKNLNLTLTEFRLLAELVGSRGRVRSRASLLSDVWGYDSEVMSRTVDTHIRRLREKLGPASGWLSTVRGVGYRIQDPSESP